MVLPILEYLLDMPDAGPREGSSEWIKEMTNSLDLVTFGQLSRYSELLRAWVRLEHEKNSSEKHGYVRLRPGEVEGNEPRTTLPCLAGSYSYTLIP